jgi:predicted  nucleic acid-binding Zn-ribbon protein
MSSPTPPALLREAHRLRRHLRELKSEIDLGPRVLKIQEQKLAAARQAHAAAHEHIQKLKLKIRDDEGTLKQVNGQLAKFEKQLNDAASPKEYEGKQSEIRQAKEKIAALEEATLLGMEELEQKTADVPNVERAWAEAQAEFEQFKVDAKERLERLQADQKQSVADLAKVDAQFPPAVKPLYDRLVKAHGPDGMAAISGKVCGHCRVGISDQARGDIAAGKFVCCSTCGRALYLEASGRSQLPEEQ